MFSRELEELRESVLRLLPMCLNERRTDAYRLLAHFAEQLIGLLHQPVSAIAEQLAGLLRQPATGQPQASEHAEVLIFKVYKDTRYEAELDISRHNAQNRDCVRYKGEWMTPTGAAKKINPTNVNGWTQFWKYMRNDGTVGIIGELRRRP